MPSLINGKWEGERGDIYGRRFLWMGWMDAAVLVGVAVVTTLEVRDNVFVVVVVVFDRSYSRADEMDELREAELSLRTV